MARVCGIRQDGDTCEAANNLAQQLQVPAGQVRRQKTDAGDVPARPTQAPNESAPHQIIADPNDRHGLGGIFRGLGGRRAVGHDGIDSQFNQFGGELR
jgi:hypothetical protein